jgi:hypothetical protein
MILKDTNIVYDMQCMITVCPECGADNSHLGAVTYRFSDDQYHFKKSIGIWPDQDTSTIEWEDNDDRPSSPFRGDDIWIFIDGECGHNWIIKFSEHKGNVFVHHEVIKFIKPEVNTKQKYLNYLQSDDWKKIAAKKRKQAKNRCQLCNNGEVTLHVHHLTYENLYKEKLIDLIVLCEKCHKNFHNTVKTDG